MAIERDVPDSCVCGAGLTSLAPDTVSVAACLSALRPDSIATDSVLERTVSDTVACAASCGVARPDTVTTLAVPSVVVVHHDDGTTTKRPRATMHLLRNGLVVERDNISLSWSINGGWEWQASMPSGWASMYAPLSDEWLIKIVDGLGGERTSPPLVLLPRETIHHYSEQSPSASLSGCDRTTHRLSRGNYSAPTFRSRYSDDIVKALADEAGVAVQGIRRWWVRDEDVKKSKLADALQRFAAIAGQELFVDERGVVQARRWRDVGGQLEIDWSTIRHRVDLERRFTRINLGKRSARQSSNANDGEQDYPFSDTGQKVFPLKTPLSYVAATDRSTIGGCNLVGLWEGDPTSNGKLIKFFNFGNIDYAGLGTGENSTGSAMGVAFSGQWPATHCSCVVLPAGTDISVLIPGAQPQTVAALLHLSGHPPSQEEPADAEPEFWYPYDSGVTPAWPADDWVDSLWPNRNWAVEVAPDVLGIKNKGWDSLLMDAVLHASVSLRQTFVYGGVLYKVDSITWRCSSGAPTTDLELVRV